MQVAKAPCAHKFAVPLRIVLWQHVGDLRSFAGITKEKGQHVLGLEHWTLSWCARPLATRPLPQQNFIYLLYYMLCCTTFHKFFTRHWYRGWNHRLSIGQKYILIFMLIYNSLYSKKPLSKNIIKSKKNKGRDIHLRKNIKNKSRTNMILQNLMTVQGMMGTAQGAAAVVVVVVEVAAGKKKNKRRTLPSWRASQVSPLSLRIPSWGICSDVSSRFATGRGEAVETVWEHSPSAFLFVMS